MPTSKRKTSRKWWKQPEIIDKRPNHQLGFKALPPSWKLAANGRWFLYFQQMVSVFPADGFCIFSRWFLCFQQMASVFPADGFCISSRWFLCFQQMVSVFPADGFCVSSRWFLCFHDAVFVSREQHALQPLALVFVSVRVLCAFAHTRVRTTIVLVQFSAKNLTHWLPFLRTNHPPRRKKSILAKVGFDAKRALF